jgi:hypothetical protein
VDKPVAGSLYIQLHHDEDTTVYLNGEQAVTVTGWTMDYASVPVSVTAARTVQPGLNRITIHCRQTTGGQYIDAGLVSLQERRWSQAQAWQWYNLIHDTRFRNVHLSLRAPPGYLSMPCRVTMGTYPISRPAGGVRIRAGSMSASFPVLGGAR